MLTDTETSPLNWNSDKPFHFPNMVRIRTIGDGSCFFHAIVKSFYVPYQTGLLNNKVFDRVSFVHRLRRDLSEKLSQPVNLDQTSDFKTYYETISRGQLPILAKEYPRYSEENMKKELIESSPVDNLYNEFISNVLQKDIYLLDFLKADVYMVGKDADILYKGRPSIVILTMPGHYELIGLQTNNGIQTMFDPNSDFITSIRNRISVLGGG